MPRLLYKPDRVFSLHNSPGPHVQRLIQRRASYWSCLRDSDSRPVDYESTALPTELRMHNGFFNPRTVFPVVMIGILWHSELTIAVYTIAIFSCNPTRLFYSFISYATLFG